LIKYQNIFSANSPPTESFLLKEITITLPRKQRVKLKTRRITLLFTAARTAVSCVV